MRTASGLCALLLTVAAAVSAEAAHHEKFVPLVAFQCGYRNRYQTEDGSWVSDENKYATCVEGKLDILKYCKKSYPDLNVTNIVEYSHEMTLADWCREDDGKQCKFTHTIRPFRCIVGEFHSEALQVPHNCRFNHENGRDSCNDYNHWKTEAAKLCGQKDDGHGKKLSVRSFAMLEPCGLDLFTGVEFVCCPAENDEEKALESKTEEKKTEDEKKTEKDEDDDSNYDDEEYEDDDKELPVDGSRDQYFLSEPTSLAVEHEKYREAMDRLDQKHRVKVNKVMKEWNELDARYNKMQKTDPKGAEAFKKEMTNRFQSTVASLEEENRKARKEIEEVHEERVMSQMNEKKRAATHAYRQALAESVGSPNKHQVLKTLKAYIRAEEKDRIHTINRFRHLLRTDTQEAMNQKALTVHRLRYIDLRINGTIAMLRDFPSLEKQIAPIAQTFLGDFRRENTPELAPSQIRELEKLPAEDRDTRVVDMLEDDFRKTHPTSFLNVKMPSYHHNIPTAATPSSTAASVAKVLPVEEESDSEEDSDSYYEDENDEEVKKTKKAREDKAIKVEVTKAEMEMKKEEEKLTKEPIVRPVAEAKNKEDDGDDDSDESSDDDDDDDEEEAKEKDLNERVLQVDIEPILAESDTHVFHYKQEKLTHRKEYGWPFTASGYIFLFVAVVFSVFVIFAIAGMRNRRRHIRFVEVDVCSPEERHVNGMQVTGYENPTYSFFDAKP